MARTETDTNNNSSSGGIGQRAANVSARGLHVAGSRVATGHPTDAINMELLLCSQKPDEIFQLRSTEHVVINLLTVDVLVNEERREQVPMSENHCVVH